MPAAQPPLPSPDSILPLERTRIRAFICDIDGCLSRGSTTHFSPRLLQRFQEANAESRINPDVPAITLCTGRTQPYVECMLQAIHGYLPALCEGGTLLFEPTRYEIATHPGFGPAERRVLDELRLACDDAFAGLSVQHEPGKFTHITVIVSPPATPQQLLAQAQALAARFGETFVVEPTRACIHFLFRHLDKGTGIDWLIQRLGVAPAQLAGIGDARPDLPFLRRVGLPCAPANAHADVKAVCRWVAPAARDADAAIDFLDQMIEHNRRLTAEGITAEPLAPAAAAGLFEEPPHEKLVLPATVCAPAAPHPPITKG